MSSPCFRNHYLNKLISLPLLFKFCTITHIERLNLHGEKLKHHLIKLLLMNKLIKTQAYKHVKNG